MQRSASVRTLKEARDGKAARVLEASGSIAFDARRVLFDARVREWITSYHGNGGQATLRENARAEYRRDLGRYAIVFSGPRCGCLS